MHKSMPSETQIERILVAELSPDPVGWFAIDPMYYRPGRAKEFAFSPNTPVSVVLDVARTPDPRMDRVFRVSVLTSEGSPSKVRRLEASVPVDSARMMIAPATAIDRLWKLTGPAARANLLPKSGRRKHASVKALVAEAETAVAGLGLELYDGPLGGSFAVPTEADLNRVQQLVSSRFDELYVNVWVTQTGSEIDELFGDGLFAVPKADGRPWAVVLSTGFGDGTYCWNETLAGNTSLGYTCSFLEPCAE